MHVLTGDPDFALIVLTTQRQNFLTGLDLRMFYCIDHRDRNRLDLFTRFGLLY